MNAADKITRSLRAYSNRKDAKILSWFFKTGPGEYGEGDSFLGIRMPILRKLVREYRSAPVPIAVRLLKSPWHEVRLFALLLMVEHFTRGDTKAKRLVFKTYMANRKNVNNWDLVDLSAPYISGPWLFDHNRSCLYSLVKSSRLWDRRIAILSTFFFIRRNDFKDTLRLAVTLLDDNEDLMHKAVGWMLREVGKRDVAVLKRFLDTHADKMPRTMLRYAIERFPQAVRRYYMTPSNRVRVACRRR